MKILTSNGKELEVRDIGPPVFKMKIKSVCGMIPLHGYKIMSDDAARKFLLEHRDNCDCTNLVLKEIQNEI